MTVKNNKDPREIALAKLKSWHEKLGIQDFPKRLGISTNEKKFREISFRAPDGVSLADAEPEDFVLNVEKVYGKDHKVIGYIIKYRVWLPSLGRKIPGKIVVRFNLYLGVIGLLKANGFFVAVEHDNFPLQKKLINVARMFGIKNTSDLEELATNLIEKEYPFFLDKIEELKVTQLGNTFYNDPTSRNEEDINLLIDIQLNENTKTKEELADLIDHRNKEMILHHIFTESELKEIYLSHRSIKSNNTVLTNDSLKFRDDFSFIILSLYFSM